MAEAKQQEEAKKEEPLHQLAQKQHAFEHDEEHDFGVARRYLRQAQPTFLIGEILRISSVIHKFEYFIGKVGIVAGWAKTVRDAEKKTIVFIELNDGSCLKGIQVVVQSTLPNFDKVLQTGTAFSFRIKGEFVKSIGQGQQIEMLVADPVNHYVKILGECDKKNYPLGKKYHKVETLREIAHLRPRSNLIGAVMRLRNALAFATHLFYQSRGFMYVHTPIITASDCEGAGEMLQVSTLMPKADGTIDQIPLVKPKPIDKKQAKKDKKNAQKEEKKKEGQEEQQQQQKAEEQSIQKDKSATTGQLSAEQQAKLQADDLKRIDYEMDFFKKPAFLTVSGQLNVETYCCAMSNVYTFGPTFRAENSHTSRHLAEFWMIEPEIAFGDLEDDMALAEDYLKYMIKYVLENCKEDLEFFEEKVKKGLIQYLSTIVHSKFEKITYTTAIEHLAEAVRKGEVKFDQNNIEWGMDMASEHERYITEKVYNGPVAVYNFPFSLKSFYMRRNEDGKTVASFDVLVPQVGEIIGGSQREERLDVLEDSMRIKGLDVENYWWYRDLRKFGTVPHAGFGLGFERMIMLCSGVENIRDVIPFPRYPGNCEF